MTNVEAARSAAELARNNAEKAVLGVGDAFRAHLSQAIDKMLEQTVIDQHKITTAKDPADLAVLKANLSNATISALQSVDSQLARIDIEHLGKKAQRNYSGMSFVKYDEVLSPLLKNTGDLLTQAGYNTEPFASYSNGRGYDITKIKGTGHAAPTAARTVDAAIEKYGQAALTLREAETAAAKAAARDAWRKA
ncbi:MAG: hypothetical protein ACRDT7_11440 [Microbacterium sp.]